MTTNQQNQHPHRSITKQPTVHYLSWGLRLLSDVASHVQRCSRCYAVEEESEHIEGGWSIATPDGISRTSIVDHPIYVEMTAGSSYFCLSCFEKYFGSATKVISSSLIDGPHSKDDLLAGSSQWFLTKKFVSELEEMRPPADIAESSSGSKAVNVAELPRPVGQWSRPNDRSDMLIRVPNEYLNGSKNLNVVKDVCNEEAMEMHEAGLKLAENEKTSEHEGTSNNRKKNKLSGVGQRCSRINGRGWQCRKTTLPGNALCEYHLALARCRTMENKFK